jgi:hypothetical protein
MLHVEGRRTMQRPSRSMANRISHDRANDVLVVGIRITPTTAACFRRGPTAYPCFSHCGSAFQLSHTRAWTQWERGLWVHPAVAVLPACVRQTNPRALSRLWNLTSFINTTNT